jgi:hypothetical protein
MNISFETSGYAMKRLYKLIQQQQKPPILLSHPLSHPCHASPQQQSPSKIPNHFPVPSPPFTTMFQS